MPYWTQGVVTLRTSGSQKVRINPTANYQTIHKGSKYTIFVKNKKSKKFSIRRKFDSKPINDDDKIIALKILARS